MKVLVPVSSTAAGSRCLRKPARESCAPRVTVRPRLGPLAAGAPRARTSAVLCTIVLTLAGVPVPARAQIAGTYFVDGSSPSCSETASGTALNPYCSISSALAAHHEPGTTIQVMPGVYREQVTVPASGASGSPVLLQAMPRPGEPVTIDGADDFAQSSLWTKAHGGAWLARSVTWSPVQVFADGARLAPYAGSPQTLPSRSFAYVPGSGLYVDAGGGNPAGHAVAVGRRAYGFYLSNRAWVTLRGFTVVRAENRAIQLTNGASNIEVAGNTVRQSGRFGIQANGCANVRIASNQVSEAGDHGISMIAGTTGCTVEDNESFRNARPSVRSANGIYLFGAPRNVIRRNRLHHNQDTGLQIQSGSNDNLSIQNLSWANGDHGFDHLHAHRNAHLGDVAFGNYKDGFSVEGNSTGQRLVNCIAVDNGLTTNEFDLWVDDSSSVDFVSDDNLFWNSSAQPPVKYRFTVFGSVADYSTATGNDTRTIQLDPRFVDAVAGDFHLRPGSPAIDNANSSVPDWPATDAEGMARVDDPATPNQGLGPVTYADRGALEYPGGALPLLPPRAGADPTPEAVLAHDQPVAGAAPAGGGAEPSVSPNPFRDEAQLRFTLSEASPVTVRVFDLRGRVVRSLAEATPLPAGVHRLALQARSDDGEVLPGGVYFYQIITATERRHGRFVVAR